MPRNGDISTSGPKYAITIVLVGVDFM